MQVAEAEILWSRNDLVHECSRWEGPIWNIDPSLKSKPRLSILASYAQTQRADQFGELGETIFRLLDLRRRPTGYKRLLRCCAIAPLTHQANRAVRHSIRSEGNHWLLSTSDGKSLPKLELLGMTFVTPLCSHVAEFEPLFPAQIWDHVFFMNISYPSQTSLLHCRQGIN